MQAASCLREGEYCLIRVPVIIVGYVRFRLKLILEAVLESKAILPQTILRPFLRLFSPPLFPSFALAPTLRVIIFTLPNLPPS